MQEPCQWVAFVFGFALDLFGFWRRRLVVFGFCKGLRKLMAYFPNGQVDQLAHFVNATKTEA
ncbi:hypothetical protein ACKS0A_00748 [Histoplasma ohiense]